MDRETSRRGPKATENRTEQDRATRKRPWRLWQPPKRKWHQRWASSLWRWTGFSEKRFWDWLQLLFAASIPVLVAIGGVWFTEQRSQADALRAYFDTVGPLILDKKLQPENPDKEAQILARARTLAVLEGLDPARKKSVVQFLYESDLLGKENAVINLDGASLDCVDLSYATLANADLQRVYLNNSTLSSTDLTGADLLRVELQNANLDNVHMDEANLQEAYLNNSNLNRATLRDADLSGTNLSGADLQRTRNLTQEQVDQADGDESTQLPEGIEKPRHWVEARGRNKGQVLPTKEEIGLPAEPARARGILGYC